MGTTYSDTYLSLKEDRQAVAERNIQRETIRAARTTLTCITGRAENPFCHEATPPDPPNPLYAVYYNDKCLYPGIENNAVCDSYHGCSDGR
jgi:hypothetical protein